MKNVHTLLIPDIHGRIFWKEAIEYYSKEKYPNLVIVFLGDYVDPYDFEGITRKDAIDNFKEIIVPCSYRTIENQISRASRLDLIMRNRKNK